MRSNAITFDAFEVSKCHEWTEASGEVIVEPCAQPGECTEAGGPCEYLRASRTFWTVYGHRTGFGAEAVADRKTKQQALDLLASILGRPLTMPDDATWDTWGRPFREEV